MRKNRFILCLWTMVLALFLLVSCGGNKAVPPADLKLEGKWSGLITVRGQQFSVVITFVIGNELRAYIDIPSQGAVQVPLMDVKYIYPDISFTLVSAPNNAVFKGKVQKDSISGSFTQGNIPGTFSVIPYIELPKNDIVSSTSETVQLETKTGTLYGTLEMPLATGPFPVILIVPDSRAVDRDGNPVFSKAKHNAVKILSKELAKYRIASLRFDKRGVAESIDAHVKGNLLTFDDYINDTIDWIRLLKQDKRFFSVGVLGYGEGSLVGLSAANKILTDFVISIAGLGKPASQIVEEQIEELLGAEFLSDARKVIAELQKGKAVPVTNPQLELIFSPAIQPFLISWFKYDPVEQLKELPCPVLIIHGTQDLEVPLSNAEILAEARPDAPAISINGMNHILKSAPSDEAGNRATYGNPDLPLAPGLIDEIYSFVNFILVSQL